MMLAVLLVLVAAAYANPIAAPTCDKERFQSCTDAYSKALGVPITSSFDQFIKAYYQMAEKYGMMIFEHICGTSHLYATCLGEGQLQACMSFANLKAIGLSDRDAGAYRAMAAAFETMCRKDIFPVLNENIKCLGDVFVNKSSQYNACVDKYSQEVTKDPSNLCKYGQEYSNCMGDLYLSACPKIVAKDMCLVTRATALANAPSTCSISCDKYDDELFSY